MAVTPTGVRSRFPEFAQHQDAQIQPHIDAAELHVDREAKSVLSTKDQDEGVMLYAAHLLAMAPQGKHARLVSRENEGKTLYLKEFERLLKKKAGGPRVI